MTRDHCVYRFYDADGELLYVGRTCRIGERFSAHRREKDWWPEVARIDLAHCATDVEAAEAERRFIRTLAPRHNVMERSPDQIAALIEAQPVLRDRLALRLLLEYHIRREDLRTVRFGNFHPDIRKLVMVDERLEHHHVEIADESFWVDLSQLVEGTDTEAGHYFMAAERTIPRAGRRRFPDTPMGQHGLHNWWHRCLENLPAPFRGDAA